MPINFNEHDREVFMKRFRAAQLKDKPDEIITVIHIEEVSIAHQYE